MSQPKTDQELLESTWRLYADEFAGHVGEVVSPYEHVETECHVDWGAQVFMFGYALGSIAGAHAIAPESIDKESDSARVSRIVDTVIEIAERDNVPVSSSTIKEDFLED